MVWRWSKTAASNSIADGTINWAEGQVPSSINDSARAEMARVAQWRDDISGTITTGGTLTAYTVTSNQVFDTLAHMDGAIIAFVPHTTSGAAPTLNVDSLGAKKIRFQTGIDIVAGALIAGTPYIGTYYNSNTEFILHNIAGNPYNVPLGGGMDYWGAAPPNSAFAFPYGQAISRTTYSTLFTLFSTTYGSGDGSTTFNLPDKAGRVSVAQDGLSGSSVGRVTSSTMTPNGVTLGAVGGEQTHVLLLAELATHNHGGATGGQSVDHTHTVTAAKNSSGFTAAPSGGAVVDARDETRTTNGTSNDHTHTINNAGSSTAHNNMQPAIICNYIVRII